MRLTNENIAQAVKDIQNFFEQAEFSQSDRTKINLTVEEALLRCQENFGAEEDFQLKMSERFGAPKVLIRIKGAAYNPLVTDDATAILSAKVMQNLLTYEGAGTTYAYKDGYNEITTFSTKERKPILNMLMQLIIAVTIPTVFVSIVSSVCMMLFPMVSLSGTTKRA